MKKILKQSFSFVMVLVMLLVMIPIGTVRISAASYTDSQLSKIKNSVIDNDAASRYVDAVMKYYLNDVRVKERNLEKGKAVVFLFDGCSDNVFSGSFSYLTDHRSAYCAVVKLVNNVPTIVYENENSSTIPDNPRMVNNTKAGNDGTDVPTVVDGIHNITKTNHVGAYAALHVADNGSGVDVIRCNDSKYYSATSYEINIHARSWDYVNTSTYSSTGCFNIGVANNFTEYNKFMYEVTGKSNAKSSRFSSSEVGTDVGVVIVDRYMYRDVLSKIYKNDTGVINKISQFSLDIANRISDKIDGSNSFLKPLLDFVDNLIDQVAKKGYVKRTTSAQGVELIKQFEGLRENAYKDSAGVWTIGYGHTGGVYSGMKITEAQATQYLKSDLSNAENAVNSFMKTHNRFVSQEQFDALVSFTFNVGSGWTKNSNYNIYKFMSTGNHTDQQVKDTFGSWCNAGGKRVAGLVTRRAKEAALYLYGNYDGNGGNSQGSDNTNISSNEKPQSGTVYSPGYYIVSTSAGLNVRSGPGTGYSKTAAYAKGTRVQVTSINGEWGKCSAGWLCLRYTSWAGELEPVINKPAAPSLNLSGNSNIATGTAVTVTWNAAADAECYDVYLKNSSGTVCQQSIGNTGRTVAFTINDAGKYTITAVSRNSKYTSNVSNTISVTAYSPSTVTFKDWNGTIISSQSVPYGGSATTPSNPSRYGWTFKRWEGSYTNVIQNQTINAYYERNIYTVSFLDEAGSLIGEKQKVQFEGKATAPVYSAPEGYDFLGWDQNFDLIESNLTVKPVIKWSNDDLPVTIQSSTTAIREKTGYTVNVVVRNNPNKETDGRVIVALKTSEGKLLSSTESAAFHLKKSADKTIEVFMPYDNAATVAEIYVVEKFSTAIPISAILSKTIDQGTAWTNWSTTKNPDDAYQAESRTEYRYRTKSTTTSSNSSLSGWTKYDTTSTWSDYGAWSGWSDTKVTASDSRQVETREVVASYNYKTVYHYYRYANSTGKAGSHTQSSTYYKWEEITLDYPLTEAGTSGGYKWWYNGTNYRTMWPCADNGSQVVTGTNYKTQYRYRDRSLKYTYYYYQWSDWSAWSTTPVTGTSTKEVQTRTTYRYLANDPNLVADTTGVSRTISGKVDPALAGEQAILFIYKVDEASDFTNEYVGQTKIGSDGSYSFKFKLREEPSIKTGDYTVTLGIEGTNAAIYLDSIEAPKPQYTVTYLDWDGKILNTQQVTEGQNAIPPTSNPSRSGYDFICWNNTATNIKDDMTVSPVYKIKSYTVVFVDWTKENVVMQTYEHGQPLVAPEIDETDDSVVVGWDAVIGGTTTVTQNMVITAKYEKKTYDVNFYDQEGNLIETVNVEYGDSVSAPENLTNSNVELIDWVPSGDMTSIKEDLYVVPVYRFKETVAAPTANIETGEYSASQQVTLSCDTENAVIYYSINGEDPKENGIEYTGPFTVNSSCELRFVACAFEKNDSDTERRLIAINDGNSNSKHIVTFISDQSNNDFDSFFVEDGQTLEYTNAAFEREGYIFEGAFCGIEGQEALTEWNFENDIVTESKDIYLYWVPKMYEVTFMGLDDEILDTQSVEHLGSAIPPEAPEVSGYVFTGYDTEDFIITSERTITAKYVPEDEYMEVTLNRTKVKLLNGTSMSIKAKLDKANSEDFTILWCSSDEDVAVVNDDGTITAVKAGTATIFAVCKESGSIAKCAVTVQPNLDEEVTLVNGSNIGFDSAEQIRGISVENNKVSDVRKLFENTDLVFVDINGYVLEEDDYIGTGTRVRLMDGTNIVDEKTIVVTGDMNGDGKINNRDSSMVIRYLVDKEVATLAQWTAIDVNGDGNVNNRDASMISRYLVGKEIF